MARIRKHRSKYQVLYRDPATKKERSAGVFSRKSDAEGQRRLLEHRLELGEWVDPESKRTPYSEWAQTWLTTRSHVSPKTRESYISLLNSRILPTFGESRLGDIRTVAIERWISGMSHEGLSASRIRQAHQVLSSTLGAAVRNQMLSTNPAAGVALPRKIQREMLIATPSEIDAIADAMPERYGTLVYVLGYCGLRIGEAIALRRRRVNLLLGELTVAESATEVHGALVFGETKNRTRRLVAVPHFLGRRLERHLEEFTAASAESLVFTSTGGGPIRLSNYRERFWKPALRQADANPLLRIHDLRHTAASLLIAQGTHPKVIQEHLGHSSIAITMDRYGHLYPSERSRVAAALDEVFENGFRSA